ncbi:MAG: hypothetical protein EPN26_03365, partial [Rhodospirillales bacterium]
MTGDDLGRLLAKMRAMMARTVQNGCTEAEELAAARMIARYVEGIDRLTGAVRPQANWAHEERA